MCINQEVGNASLDARCNGAKEAMEEAGGTLTVQQVNLNDQAGAQKHDQLGPPGGQLDRRRPRPRPDRSGTGPRRRRNSSAAGDLQLATFDLSPDVLDAIEAGTMSFAIDQQQYLQGYLPDRVHGAVSQQPEHRRRR